MIRVTIDLWPRGSEAAKRRLGTIDIFNTGESADPEIGCYDTRFTGRNNVPINRRVKIVGWPRNKRPVFSLLLQILKKAGY